MYRAYDVDLVPLPYTIDTFAQIFVREALVWSGLEHPNVLPFYGLCRLSDANDRICLISPWMENGNVSSYIRAHPSVPRLKLVRSDLPGGCCGESVLNI